MGDAFTVVFGGTLAFFVILVLLLGVFSKRSARDYLDWKPARSPEAELQDELDDVEQMIAAQNELKRRRGAPEISEQEVSERVREDREQLRRWRES
jgi:Tfp pilus assembly protein PilN